MIEKLKSNLLLFGKIIMPKVFWADFSFVHYEVADLLVNPDEKRLNVIIPRGLGKTTLASQVYPLHHIFCSDFEGPKGIVIVSKTQQHAINCLQSIKDVLDYSLEFRTIFGYQGVNVCKTYRNDMIVLKDGSYIIAKGMGQPIRGMNINGVRPSLIILDDPEDENNTKTSEAMNANLMWLLKGGVPAVDTRYGKIVIIGTPIHQLCIVEQVNRMKDWKTVRYSYLFEKDGVTKSIWEEVKSVKDLTDEKNAMEAIGKLSVFYAERMCEITGDEDQLFGEDTFRYHDYELIHNEHGEAFLSNDMTTIPVNVFMGVDPASSTKQTADFSVIMPIAIDADDNRYVLPYYHKRVKPMLLADAIIEYYKKYLPQKTRIESTGYQEMIRDYLQTVCKKEDMYISGLEIKEIPKNSKSARLESMQPHFARGKVYMKRNMEDLQKELLLYPRASHDDLLDGLFYAMKNIYKPYHSAETMQVDKPKKTSIKQKLESWMSL